MSHWSLRTNPLPNSSSLYVHVPPLPPPSPPPPPPRRPELRELTECHQKIKDLESQLLHYRYPIRPHTSTPSALCTFSFHQHLHCVPSPTPSHITALCTFSTHQHPHTSHHHRSSVSLEQSDHVYAHQQVKVTHPILAYHTITYPTTTPSPIPQPHHHQNIMSVLCASEEEEVVPLVTEMVERLEARNRIQKVCMAGYTFRRCK